jgi:hypothetical protein
MNKVGQALFTFTVRASTSYVDLTKLAYRGINDETFYKHHSIHPN